MHPLLSEGLTDAAGFVLGVLIAYGAGRAFGFDPMAAGYDGGSIVGIVLAGLGGGIGVHTARWWRRSRAARMAAQDRSAGGGR